MAFAQKYELRKLIKNKAIEAPITYWRILCHRLCPEDDAYVQEDRLTLVLFWQMETSGGSESSSGEDAEARVSRRGHVLAELLQTERAYVQELGSILTVSTIT